MAEEKIIGGTAQVRVDGITVRLMADLKYSFDVEKKTKNKGMDGHVGTEVEPVVPYLEMKISDTSKLDILSLSSAEDATVSTLMRNGKIGVWPLCDQVNQVEIDGKESSMTLRFESSGTPYEQKA